jgi:Tfp pilus assembly protein FimT
MIELMVVVAIMMVVVAAGLPSFFNAVDTYRLRSTANDVASLMQRARMWAIKNNTYYPVRITTVTQNGVQYTQVYIDLDVDSVQDTGERLIQLPKNFSLPSSGYPTMGSSTLGYTPQAQTVAMTFNGRGLPCVMNSNQCTNFDSSGNVVGFVYFLKDTKSSGNSWAAIAASPAGRIKIWMWNSASSTWVY